MDNVGCKSYTYSSCGKECKYLTAGMKSCIMAEVTIKWNLGQGRSEVCGGSEALKGPSLPSYIDLGSK